MEGETPYWNLDNTDYSALVDNAIDQVADVLGTAYAIHNNAGDQQLATIQFDVESVNSIEKYRYIENYLADLNVVENSRPLSVNGQNVVFEVTLRGAEEDFINLIKSYTAFSEMQTPLPVSTEPQFVEKIELSAGDTKVVAAPDLNEAVSSEQKNIDSIVVEQAPVKRIPVYRYQLMK